MHVLRNSMALFWALVLVLGFAWGPIASAQADQTEERLNEWFDVLLNADIGSYDAVQAQQEIWALWTRAPTASTRVLMTTGLQQMQQGAFGDAIQTFTALIDIAPDYAEGWNKRATVYFYAGNLSDSLADIDKTLDLEPRHFGAQSGQGMVYDALQEPEAAIEAFEKALRLNPHMMGIRERIDMLRTRIEGKQL